MMITSIGRPTGLTRRGILGRAAAAVVTASMATRTRREKGQRLLPASGTVQRARELLMPWRRLSWTRRPRLLDLYR